MTSTTAKPFRTALTTKTFRCVAIIGVSAVAASACSTASTIDDLEAVASSVPTEATVTTSPPSYDDASTSSASPLLPDSRVDTPISADVQIDLRPHFVIGQQARVATIMTVDHRVTIDGEQVNVDGAAEIVVTSEVVDLTDSSVTIANRLESWSMLVDGEPEAELERAMSTMYGVPLLTERSFSGEALSATVRADGEPLDRIVEETLDFDIRAIFDYPTERVAVGDEWSTTTEVDLGYTVLPATSHYEFVAVTDGHPIVRKTTQLQSDEPINGYDFSASSDTEVIFELNLAHPLLTNEAESSTVEVASEHLNNSGTAKTIVNRTLATS